MLGRRIDLWRRKIIPDSEYQAMIKAGGKPHDLISYEKPVAASPKPAARSRIRPQSVAVETN